MSLKLRSILVLVVGTVLGLTVSVGSTVLAERDTDRAAAASLSGLSPEYAELLSRVVARVRAEYVDPLEEQRIVENAIRGILGELDPHSKYLPPNDYEEMRISTTGNYSGVGIEISVKDGKVMVVTPFEGTPAAEAGILAGDVVVAVDDMPVSGESLKEAYSRMRGAPGTTVIVEVTRDGVEGPLQFALTRANVHVETVRYALLDGDIGYVRLTSFAKTTAADLTAATAVLEAQSPAGLSGLVLDLRNNPGGVLESAIEVADLFLADGLIVSGNGRARQSRFERYADAGDQLENLPLVVVVNSGSASASEIVAGALKDHGRAQLIGEQTYGKGSVQTVMPIGRGSAIKLTTSLYITPAGTQINGVGIAPDVQIKGAVSSRQYRGPGSDTAALDDAQLREALRVIGYPVSTVAEASVADAS